MGVDGRNVDGRTVTFLVFLSSPAALAFSECERHQARAGSRRRPSSGLRINFNVDPRPSKALPPLVFAVRFFFMPLAVGKQIPCQALELAPNDLRPLPPRMPCLFDIYIYIPF